MIKINLSPEQIKEAQENHWKWFKDKQFSKLVKKKKSCTNDNLKNYFSELIRNEQKLRNIVIGKPSCIRTEIQYVIDNYSELISDKEDDVDETIEKELKYIKDQLPTQTSIEDNNWEAEYDKLYKLISESNYFDIKDFKKCTCKTHVIKLISNVRNKINNRNIHDIITSVFSYKDFTNKENTIWNAYDWVKFLNLKTCPYCNRQFIHFYDRKGDEKQMRPALDHFYPKSKYPFLSISLFNLIPSCHACNSDFKLKEDFFEKNHINPFEEGYGKDGKFFTDFIANKGKYNIEYLTSVKNKVDFLLYVKIDNGIDPAKKEKIKNSNKTFRINGLYQNHKDYAHEIIKKTHMYNNTRLKELMESFGGQLFDSKEELKQLIMGNYLNPDQQGDRVLAKLTQDIFDEFKIEEIWGDATED